MLRCWQTAIQCTKRPRRCDILLTRPTRHLSAGVQSTERKREKQYSTPCIRRSMQPAAAKQSLDMREHVNVSGPGQARQVRS